MNNFKKILSVILSAVIMMQAGDLCVANAGADEPIPDYTIVSPYADVIWSGEGAWGAYKGSLHSHTTYSDADDTLPVMVKEAYNQDYDFLAIADHGITGVDWDQTPAIQPLYLYQYLIDNPYEHLTTEEYEAIKGGTYPLYDGTIRNKKMVPVLGANELNNLSLTKNHVNGFFLAPDKGNGFAGGDNEYGFDKALKYIDENGGLSHINHPGDWLRSNDNPEIVNDPESIKFFGDLILKYDSCLGTEVLNERNGTTGYDRILWDNLLMYCLPYGKNVIGFSNTDAHNTDNVDTSYSYFMMEKNNVDNIKKTMQSGAFFGVTTRLRPNDKIGPYEEIDCMNKGIPCPMFTSLTVDGHKITVTAKESKTVQFIANGNVIFTKDIGTEPVTLDLDTIEGVEDFKYVRVELFGDGGLCYSQALVIDRGEAPLEFVAEELSPIEAIWNYIRGTIFYALIFEIIDLF
ncbi:MAG: PHP domain-containing protein [Clostridia bacterium]|nr:PHP domain-containing protein [Clostridia bacterium]